MSKVKSVLVFQSTSIDEGVSFPENTLLLGRLKNSEALKNLHKM